MKANSLFEYFFFGTSVRYLQDSSAGARIHDTRGGWYILSNIEQLYKQLDDLNLQVTARACDDLREIYTELQNEDDDAVLSDEQADRLSQVKNKRLCCAEPRHNLF